MFGLVICTLPATVDRKDNDQSLDGRACRPGHQGRRAQKERLNGLSSRPGPNLLGSGSGSAAIGLALGGQGRSSFFCTALMSARAAASSACNFW